MTDVEVADAYTPEQVEQHLRHWEELVSAAEGGTGTLNGRGAGGGGRKRMTLVAVKADLERAADTLPLGWLSTGYVFSLQQRGAVWRARLRGAGGPSVIVEDVPMRVAYEHMAHSLGWTPTSPP